MPQKITLTVAEIEDRFEEAALTMKRLPLGGGPKGYGSSWPEYVRSRFTAYGADQARVRVVPSAKEIQRMDDVIEWLKLITNRQGEQQTAQDRKIVWLKAENMPWRAICGRVGLSRSQAHRRWAAALITVQRRLEKGPAHKARGGDARNEGGQKQGGPLAAAKGRMAAAKNQAGE